MAARTPFRVHVMKQKSQHHKYECCAVTGTSVYIGTGDGSIVRFDIRVSQAHEFETQGSNLSRVGPGKRPINQLGPIPEIRTMLALCDGQILVLNLDEMETPNPVIIRTRNIACFAVKKERNVYHLAALTRNKLVVLYEHRRDNDEWVFVRELAIPEGARTINWSGRNVLVGFRKEYVLLEVGDGRPKNTVGMGKGNTPLVCNLDVMKEVIMAVEGSLGVRMDAETCKPTSSFAIRWASVPSSVVYVHPYILSVVDGNAVEVHYPFRASGEASGGTASFCQSLPIKYADKISTPTVIDCDWPKPSASTVREVLSPVGRSEVIIVTSTDNSFYLLEMQPIPDQVATLFRSQSYDEALELCRLCQNETNHLLPELKVQYGNHYFGLKKFQDAFTLFEQVPVDPRLLVTYYNKLVLPSLTHFNKPPLRVQGQFTTAGLPTAAQEEALRALIHHLMPQRRPPPPKDENGTPNFTTNHVLIAGDDTKQQLATIDTAQLQAYLLIDREDDALSLLSKPNLVLYDDAKQFLEVREEWVCLVALLNSIGKYRESLTMLRNLGNHGSVDSSRPLAASLSQTPGALYFKKLVEKDLPVKLTSKRSIQQIVEQTEHEDVDMIVAQVLGVLLTVYTLKQLDGETHHDLIKEFSKWVLVSFPPEFTTRIFTESVGAMKPTVIAHFLDSIPDLPPTVPAYFLERTLGHRCDQSTDKDLHNRRVIALLAVIASGNDRLVFQEKLLAFLKTSQFYNPEETLAALCASRQVGELVNHRAVVYKRMGRHSDAVKMYLQAKGGFDQAVQYANEVSEVGPTGTILDTKGEAYRALLETLVRPQDGVEARTHEALELVNRYPHVDAAVALEILPETTLVSQLDDFIKNALRTKHARARELEVQKNVLESLRRHNLVAATRLRVNRITIDHNTRCAVCRKLIRDTVFARYPNGVVVHQACLVDDHVCPQTGVDFTKSIETLMV